MSSKKTEYEIYYSKVGRISRMFSITSGVPYDEIRSYLNEEYFKAMLDFDKTKSSNLSNWLNERLKARAIDFITKHKYAKSFIEPIYLSNLENNNNDDESAATFEPSTEYDLVELEVINSLEMKTDEDKRQLINALTENCDTLTTAIVDEYLNSDNPNPYSIGKKLGVHNMTVVRQLRKLTKFYDATRFGDLDNYLAV